MKICVYDHTTHHRPIGEDHSHSDPCGYGGHLNSHSTINSCHHAHEVYFLVYDEGHLILILNNNGIGTAGIRHGFRECYNKDHTHA